MAPMFHQLFVEANGWVTARVWSPSVAPVVEVATEFGESAVQPSVSASQEKKGAAEHTGAESAAIYPERMRTNRGSTYVGPEQLFGAEANKFLISPSSDCRNAGGETTPSDGTPGCYEADGIRFQGRLQGDFPHVEAADYTKPSD